MSEPAFSPLPLDFHARVPCQAAFASIAVELAGRLAKVAGFDAEHCAGIGKEVGEAFESRLQHSQGQSGAMELAMRVTADAFSATVSCESTELLNLSWPRPA